MKVRRPRSFVVASLCQPASTGKGERSATNDRSSAADASSRFRETAASIFSNAAAVVAGLPETTASATCANGVRIAGGSESDDNHCLAAADRPFASACAMLSGGSIPAASRPATRQAIATSRSPPSEARPANETSARKRKCGVARAKRGCCPITLSNLGIH